MNTKDRKLYTDQEVYNMLGIGKTKWFKMKREGLTPKPFELPGYADQYTIEAIDEWRLGSRQAS